MKKSVKLEIIIIICVIVICLVSIPFLFNKQNDDVIAEIYYYDEILQTVDLSTASEQVLNFSQAPNVYINISDNHEIYFAESDCPDKICVHSGKLSTAAQTAACLPNGIMIRLSSNDSIDFIAQ